jgi:hypothetical protein
MEQNSQDKQTSCLVLYMIESHQILLPELRLVELLDLGMDPLLREVGLAQEFLPFLLGLGLFLVLLALKVLVCDHVLRVEIAVPKGQVHRAAGKAKVGGGLIRPRREKAGFGLALAFPVADVRGRHSRVFHFLEDQVAAKDLLDAGGGVVFLMGVARNTR